MKDRYSVILTYQDKTRVHTVGTWAEITEWMAGQNPGTTVLCAEIGHVIAEGTFPGPSRGRHRVREHRGFGHGLTPGTDHDMNCTACKRERAAGAEPVITG